MSGPGNRVPAPLPGAPSSPPRLGLSPRLPRPLPSSPTHPLLCAWLCFPQRAHSDVRDHEELWPHLWKALVAGPVQNRVQDFWQHETPRATVGGGWWQARCPGEMGALVCAQGCVVSIHSPQKSCTASRVGCVLKRKTPFLALLSQSSSSAEELPIWGWGRGNKSPLCAHSALEHRTCRFSRRLAVLFLFGSYQLLNSWENVRLHMFLQHHVLISFRCRICWIIW